MTVTDLELGSFSDEPPWIVDPDAMRVAAGRARACGARSPTSSPASREPGKVPPGHAGASAPTALLGRRARPAGTSAPAARAARRRSPILSRRLRARRRAARPHLHQARPDHLLRRGDLPARSSSPSSSGAATRCRPSRSRVVRRVVEEDLGRPLEEVFARFHPEPLAAASIAQVHRATLLHRRGRRGEGAAPVGRAARAPGPPGDGVDRAVPGRAHPGRRAGQPAGARRAVRRDDHRGARLPPRGREHARRGPVLRRPRPARLRDPPPAPRRSSPAGCS